MSARPATRSSRRWIDLLASALPPAAVVGLAAPVGLPAAAGIAALLCGAVGLVCAHQRRFPHPAVSGLIGAAIAATITWYTGSPRDALLPGMWWNLVAAGLFLGSVVVRRPLVGVAWSVARREPLWWRHDRVSRRALDGTSSVFAVVFAARYLVQARLYDADLVGWAAAAKVAMGFPLTAAAVVIAVGALRRVERRTARCADTVPR